MGEAASNPQVGQWSVCRRLENEEVVERAEQEAVRENGSEKIYLSSLPFGQFDGRLD